MKRITNHLSDLTGSGLVESLVAFTIVSATAVAIYPMFVNSKKQTKYGDAKQLCMNVVRAKLDEYRFGRVLDLNLAPYNTAKFKLLTLPSLSGSSSTITAGAATLGTSGGFSYAKFRYNEKLVSPGFCNATSNGSILEPTASLGLRECIGDNSSYLPASDDNTACTTLPQHSQDQRVRDEIPGFRMYVKLQLTTPWDFRTWGVAPTTAAKKNLVGLTDGCPNFGRWNSGTNDLYNFDGAGDAIQVTVTGLMDVQSASAANTEFAGIPANDKLRMSCSASATIRPEVYPARYYLDPSGRIFNIHGHGNNGSEDLTDNNAWVFRSIYQQGVGGVMASSIKSFAVHPRGTALYVLRKGSLTRYGDCGGVPIDCNTTPASSGGMSDTGNDSSWPTVQEFELPPSIVGIGVDFRNGKIYGMMGDHQAVVSIDLNGGVAIQGSKLGDLAGTGRVLLAGMAFNTVSVGAAPFPSITSAGRLTGFFLKPEGDEAYVSDMTSSLTLGSSSYSSAIYRISDNSLANAVARLPVDAVSFSP